MADANTCQQCGAVKTVRQSGKGFLVCQPCYEKIYPEEALPIVTEEKKQQQLPIELTVDRIKQMRSIFG